MSTIYSIVIPVFNEAPVLDLLDQRLQWLLGHLDAPSEVIFVDDGSTDESMGHLRELQRRDARYRIIGLSRNFGHQAAVTAGLGAVSGLAAVVMDADLQDPPEVVLEMARRWREGFHVVYGLRSDRTSDSRFKRGTADVFYRLLRHMSPLDIPMQAGDFRLMDTMVVQAFTDMGETNRYVRGMIAWLGFRQTAVEYTRPGRAAGTSEYSTRRMAKLAADGVIGFSRAPLTAVLGAGVATMGGGAVVAGLAGVRAIRRRGSARSLAAIASVTIGSGAQLAAVGVVGVYVGRVLDEARGRPLYVVAERHGFGRAPSATPLSQPRARAFDETVDLTPLAVGTSRMTLLIDQVTEVEAPDAAPPLPVPRRRGPSDTAAVAVLSVVAFTVRAFVRRGLWLDELTSVHQARLSFHDMVSLLYSQDNHPPLYQSLLWVDVRVLGDSELALRLPSMVISALLVPAVFVLARDLYDRRAGLVAAGLTTIAPVAVWYGQEARMYALFMLLAVVTTWAQLWVLRTGARRFWLVFTAGSVALVATQYFGALHVLALHVVFLVAVRRAEGRERRAVLRPWLASLAVQVVVLAPLVPFALHQFAHNQRAGFGFDTTSVATGSAVVPRPSIYTLLTNVVWAIWGYQPARLTALLVAMWPLGLLLVLLLMGRRRQLANRYLAVLIGLPTAAMFLVSFVAAKSRSLAEVRYFAGAVPLLLVLLAGLVTSLVANGWARRLVIGVLALSMVGALVNQSTNADNPRLYGYREALRAVADDAQPGDRVVYTPRYLDYLMEYYSPGVPSSPLGATVDGNRKGRVILIASLGFADSAASKRAAFAAAGALGSDHRLEWMRSWPQVTVWVFS